MRNIRNLDDLAKHVGASDSSVDMIARRIYKDTQCGAWFKYDPPLNMSYGSVLVGTIVEGSPIEPIVSPRRLYFPFKASDFDGALEDIDLDSSVCWEHVNECEPECSGGECGYSSHAGFREVAVNQRPKDIGGDMTRDETWAIIKRIGWKKRAFSVPKTARAIETMFLDLPRMKKDFVEELQVFQIALYEEIRGADKKSAITSHDCLRALTWHYVGLGRKAFEKAYANPKKAIKRYREGNFPSVEDSFQMTLPRI